MFSLKLMASLLAVILAFFAIGGCKSRAASAQSSTDETPAAEGEAGLPDVAQLPAAEDVRLLFADTDSSGDIRWGYIDGNGEVAIVPQFDAAGTFHEEVAAVKIDELWGYINATGELIVEPQFYRVDYSFHEGVARVVVGGGGLRWGYVNLAGELIVEPQYERADDFYGGGPARVMRRGPAVWVHERRRVEVRLDAELDDIHSPLTMPPSADSPRPQTTEHCPEGPGEGLVCVRRRPELWGYIDATGQVVLEPQFESASVFSEGVACVRREGAELSEYLDTAGNTVFTLPAGYDGGYFQEGLAPIYRKIDDDEIVADESIVAYYDFMDELIEDPDDHGQAVDRFEVLYIDPAGQIVIETGSFVERGRFSEGLAGACDLATGRWGFIDSSGEWQVQPQYRRVRPFSEGLAAVQRPVEGGRRGELWGYINKAGEWVIEAQFDQASSFEGGVATVEVESELESKRPGEYFISGLNRVIDREGELVFFFPDIRRGAWFYQGYLEASFHFADDPPGSEHRRAYISHTGELVWPKGLRLLPDGRVDRISQEEPDSE